MIKLLRSNFTRLWKSKPFWVCMMLSLALSEVNCIGNARLIGWEHRTAEMFLSGAANTMLFSAIFASLYLGTDYSNGTIRNKLIIGSKRTDIYFSNLVTSVQWMVCAVFACFGKELGMDAGELLFQMFIIVCAIISISAVFTLLGMLINSKSTNTAITITAAFVILIGGAIIMNLLAQPEFITTYVMDENAASEDTVIPNPAYIPPGAKRDILTAVNDVLPGGQIMQVETGSLHNKELMPLYSLGVLTVTTAAGAVVFRRKDLK